MQAIEAIIKEFDIPGELVKIKANKEGHINSTFISTFKQGAVVQKYTHQKVNNIVFPKPERVMENIQRITSHIQQKVEPLANKEKRCLSLVPTRKGTWYAYDDQGNLWRTYRFVDEVNTYPFLDNETLAFRFGQAVGTFQMQLSDFPGESLHTTIEKFHDMHARYAQLRKAMKADPKGRLAQVEKEVAFYLENEMRGCVLTDALESEVIPIRVTHNDTKINNILFDVETGEGICVIDLDTVMPGTILFDTGDMLRTGSITAMEDERDLGKVSCDEKLFVAMIKGYRSKADAFLTEAEKRLLAESGRATTQIMGVRFLTDYLNGDIYYNIERETHNLDRCRTQMALILDMDRKWEMILKQLD